MSNIPNNAPPQQEIIAAGCRTCPPCPICICPVPADNVYCATPTCRVYIQPRNISGSVATCYTCGHCTCSICRNRFHAPRLSCPAERTISGALYALRYQYIQDREAISKKEITTRQVYDQLIRENQSIAWQCRGVIHEGLLVAHRERLQADREKVNESLESLRQQLTDKFRKEAAATSKSEESNAVLKMASAPRWAGI